MPANSVNSMAEMTFLNHLEEFRRRIIISLVAVGLFMLLSLMVFAFYNDIMRIIT